MHRVRGDDLMLALLDRHELAEFGRLRDLALPNGFGVRLEYAEYLLGDVCVSTEEPRARPMAASAAAAAAAAAVALRSWPPQLAHL